MTYYNSVPEGEEEVQAYTAKAKTQQQYILALFQDGKPHSPTDIHNRCLNAGMIWPITSIRRAITDLDAEMYIRKTGDKSKGRYGRNENKWEKSPFEIIHFGIDFSND